MSENKAFFLTGFLICLMVVFAMAVVHLRSADGYNDTSTACVEKGGVWQPPVWVTPGYCKPAKP